MSEEYVREREGKRDNRQGYGGMQQKAGTGEDVRSVGRWHGEEGKGESRGMVKEEDSRRGWEGVCEV